MLTWIVILRQCLQKQTCMRQSSTSLYINLWPVIQIRSVCTADHLLYKDDLVGTVINLDHDCCQRARVHFGLELVLDRIFHIET